MSDNASLHECILNMRPGSIHNGMSVCVCECVFEGFCHEGPFCRGSDGWGWVSEAFSINLPFSLQGSPVRLCSFTCSLSLSHAHTHWSAHTLSFCHTSTDCNCMLPISYTLFINTYALTACVRHEIHDRLHSDCNYTWPHLHTHQHRNIVSSTIIPYLFMHAPHKLTLLPFTSSSSIHLPGWVNSFYSLSVMLSHLTILPLVAWLALAQQVSLHSDT